MFLKEIINYSPTIFLFGGILILIILVVFFCWIFKEIRSICQRVAGYIILGQLILILLSCGVFVGILIYYILFAPSEEVPMLNIFLTVVVGFLGTIIGVFFSEKAFEKIVKDLEDKYRAQRNETYREYQILAKRLSKLDKLK